MIGASRGNYQQDAISTAPVVEIRAVITIWILTTADHTASLYMNSSTATRR